MDKITQTMVGVVIGLYEAYQKMVQQCMAALVVVVVLLEMSMLVVAEADTPEAVLEWALLQ